MDGSESLNEAISQERREQVWAARAAQMAQVELGENTSEQAMVVLVRLGREVLALPVENVFDIREKETVTRVPRVPAWVVGVTNLRGRILSVIDLRAYLGLPGERVPDPEQEDGYLIVVQIPSMELILWVDQVPGVESLLVRHDLADSLQHHLNPEYILTVVERKDHAEEQRHITVLDIEALLTDPHLIIHEELA